MQVVNETRVTVLCADGQRAFINMVTSEHITAVLVLVMMKYPGAAPAFKRDSKELVYLANASAGYGQRQVQTGNRVFFDEYVFDLRHLPNASIKELG